MWVVLILGLIAAGIYTGNALFYAAAGLVGAFIVLTWIVAAAGVKAISKRIDRDFHDFGSGFNRFNRRF